jgi:hypothetical protein
MHRSGHLTLIKTTLAVMPVYNAISHALMAWVIKAFVRNFRAFLWSGSKSTHNGKCLMAWDQEQRPLSLGGLGIKDLELMGRALQLCWLWQQCSDPSRLWASIPVSDDVMTREFFKASIVITVGSGVSTLFWEEHWLNDKGIQEITPDLVAAVPIRRRRRRTVRSALEGNNWMWHI